MPGITWNRRADSNVLKFIEAAFLGFVEGLTEFLPVSSTGHLLLVQHFISWGDDNFGKTFAVLIQLGAILAILSVYFFKLLSIARGLLFDRRTQMFVLGVLIAFLPAAVLGFFLHGLIKSVLFNPVIVCFALIAGGLVLMVVDDLKIEHKYSDIMDLPLLTCLAIGAVQCLAMIPGVSRSGATIVGAMLSGADKRTAAEFSFFLAMPTMAGAFALDLFKNYKTLDSSDGMLIAVGFAVAFVTAFAVVRGFLAIISSRGFTPFAWWRIVVGSAGLAAIYAFG